MSAPVVRDYTPEQRQAELAAHPAMSAYYTPEGRLTWHALQCGYQETRGRYAVRLYAIGRTVRVVGFDKHRTFHYKSFRSLPQAREYFDKLELAD